MVGSRLVWAVVVGFLCGVFFRSLFLIGMSYALGALLLAGAAIAFGFLKLGQMQAYFVIAVAFTSLAVGIARMDADVISGDPTLTAHLGGRVTLLGSVSREPDVRDNGVRLSIVVQHLIEGSSTIAVHAGVLAQVPPHTEVRYGDAVQVSGTLDLPQSFDTGLGRQFDYPDYLAVNGIAYTLSFAQVDPLGTNTGNPLQAFAIEAKQRYLAGLDAVLPEPSAGLAGGITVGDKRSIGPALSADFQKVSLIQMVVLSGYNITVVINFVAKLFSWTSRYAQLGAGAFVIIFFMLISGGASSAVRAGIMAGLAMYARSSRRTFEPMRALGVTAVVMVAWNPFILAFDPGFQLSALAMLGLTLYTPIFSRYLGLIPARLALREVVASSIATQLMVMPLILYQSGQLSVLAVPANVLAMIPVPLAMLTAGIAALGGMFLGSVAVPLAFPAYTLLSYIIAVAHFLATLPFASISIGAFSPQWLIATYVGLFFPLFIIQKTAAGGKFPSAASSLL